MRPNPQETADLVTFAEEILDEKFHFVCSISFGQRKGISCIHCLQLFVPTFVAGIYLLKVNYRNTRIR